MAGDPELLAKVRREAFDTAMLTLLVERPGLGGDNLLADVLEEASDALARLRERGLLLTGDAEEE